MRPRIPPAVPPAAVVLLALAASAPGQPGESPLPADLFGPGPGQDVLSVQTRLSQDRIRPGDRFRVAVVLTPKPPYHVNSHRPLGTDLVPTTVSLTGEGLTVEQVLYPPGERKKLSYGTLDLYVGRTVIVARLAAADTLSGEEGTLRGKVAYQACDDSTCLFPTETAVTIRIPLAPAGAAVTATHADLFAAVESRPTETRATTAPATQPERPAGAAPGGFGEWLEQVLRGDNLALQLAAMFLLGLFLNATGCTLPALGLTLAFFGNQAQGRLGRQFALAAAFSGGMLVLFAALGGISVAFGVAFTVIYQHPWAVALLALVIVVFSGSLFGFYTINPPQAVYKVAGGRAGLGGAFVMGLLAVILAIPCTAGFLFGIFSYCQGLTKTFGSAAAAPRVLGVWLLVGVGMASPFLVLALSPQLTRRLPKTGHWTELVKKSFGFLLLIVAAYTAKSLLPAYGFEVLSGAIVLAWGAFVGLYGWEKVSSRSGRAAALVLGVAIMAAGTWGVLLPNLSAAAGPASATADASHTRWTAYTAEVLEQAKRDGRPVVLKVTADWCAICKELERTVYADRRVIAESRRDGGVLFVKADVTRADAPFNEVIRRRGLGGPPQTFLYNARGEQVDRLQKYTAEGLLERIRALRAGQ
jgi:thiol:disulfide interchange protein DsbD